MMLEKGWQRFTLGVVLTAVMVPARGGAEPTLAAATVELPPVATVLPANTPGIVLVNTSTQMWSEFQQFNPVPEQYQAGLRSLLESKEFTWQDDVMSWLGDRAAIALPSLAFTTKTVPTPVLLLPIKDSSRFNRFLAKVKTKLGNPQIEREYKGATILQWIPPAPTAPVAPALPESRLPAPIQTKATPGNPPTELEPPLPPTPSDRAGSGELFGKGVAVALFANVVAIANQAQTLETLVDKRLNQPSLAENPLFQRTLRHPRFGRSLFTSYTTVEGLFQYLSSTASLFSNPALSFLLPSVGASVAQSFNTFDSHTWLAPEGIHSQTSIYYTSSRPSWATQTPPQPDQILQRLPAATFLSANSRNFKQQWQSWRGDSITPGSRFPWKQLQQEIQRSVGLDVDRDLIPWLDGEYAFFLYPSKGGFFNLIAPNFDLGMGLMLQTSDRAAAETALKKLNQHIQKISRGEVKAVPRRINHQAVTSWEGKDRNKTVSALAYGWLDHKTLVITSGTDALAGLMPRPYLPLDRNYTFKTATATLPLPNAGYFYINMGSSLSFLYGLVIPRSSRNDRFVQEIQRIVGSVRSVSTTNSATAEAMRVDTLWVLARQKQPQRLQP